MKKISIIVPMYNCEDTVCALIDSIEAQVFSDYEVFLVDDGSKDNTLNVVLEKCEGKTNYTVLRQENAGAPSARNLGLKHAAGEYVYFCDADDLLDECALSEMIQVAERQMADLVIGKIAHFQRTLEEKVEMPILPASSSVLGELRYFMCDPVPGTKLYKKSIIDQNNLIFDSVSIGQDLNFYIKYLMVCNRAAIVDHVVYYYRQTEGSISRTYNKNKILGIRDSIEKIREFAKNAQFSDKKEKLLCLEYVKLGNYLWQLRKKNHFSREDYREIRKQLCSEVHIHQILNIKLLYANSLAVIQFFMIKLFGIVLKPI